MGLSSWMRTSGMKPGAGPNTAGAAGAVLRFFLVALAEDGGLAGIRGTAGRRVFRIPPTESSMFWIRPKTFSTSVVRFCRSAGTSLAQSKKGTAGTHVGRELDAFVTWKVHAHTFGAGFGHYFKGEFVDNATLHINPRYFYVFQQYSFK